MEALDVLRAVICGLSEVNEIVHRDLKPANILFHEGAWKIADFGIAKFVENSTSTKTLRDCLSPQYGAPEQWLLQGPTSATDLYAVGCIAHAILTGKPPFDGTIEELKEKHLKEAPQQLQILPAAARTAVNHMLRKNPELRPSIERCLELFAIAEVETDAPAPGHLAGMMEAVSELADQRAREESRAIAAEDRRQRRSSILAEALSDLQRIRSRLFAEVERHASELVDHRSESRIRIGAATLVFDATLGAIGKDGIRESDSESASGDGGWGVHKRQSNWDIVAHGLIRLEQRASNSTYVRSANLVFGRPNETSEYRWYEMAFWSFSRKERDEPYGLEYPWVLDEALSSAMGINSMAHDPTPIDAEDEDQFIDYWLSQLSKAMRGHLHPPRQLPFSR